MRDRVAALAAVGVVALAGCSAFAGPDPDAAVPSATSPWSSAPAPFATGSPSAGPSPTASASGTAAPPASPSPTASAGATTGPTTGPSPSASAGGSSAPGTSPTPGTSPAPGTPDVVIDVLAAFRDAGSTESAGAGSASAATTRSIGSRRGFFGDARAALPAGRAGEASAFARGATRSLTVPRTGTYAYDWRIRYHVSGSAPGGADDDARVRATSTVDPGVFGERGPVITADVPLGAGVKVPIDNTITQTGRVRLTKGQRLELSLEASCTVTSSGLSKDSTCRSWVGLDRFVVRLVADG